MALCGGQHHLCALWGCCFFAHWGGVLLPTDNVFLGLRPGPFFGKGSFRPSGIVLSWACGPGFFSLRAFCLRRGTFCSPKKFLKNGSLRWPCGALASLATLLELPSSAPISEGRGTLCKTWRVSAVPFEAASKHTPHSQPSWGFPQLRPSARVARPRAKYGGCQQCSLHSTSCLRHEAFK